MLYRITRKTKFLQNKLNFMHLHKLCFIANFDYNFFDKFLSSSLHFYCFTSFIVLFFCSTEKLPSTKIVSSAWLMRTLRNSSHSLPGDSLYISFWMRISFRREKINHSPNRILSESWFISIISRLSGSLQKLSQLESVTK